MSIGIDGVRENFEAVDEARSWPAEVLRAVRDEDAPIAHGRQAAPAGHHVEMGNILQRPIDVESTARDEDDLRLPRQDLVPAQRARGDAFAAQSFHAARESNELRAPVAARERRIEPLQERDARACRRRRRARGDRIDSRAKRADDRRTSFGHAGGIATASIAAKTSSSVSGSRLTTGGAPGSRHAAARTSASATAQTSHSACVTIRSGASASSTVMSSVYSARSVSRRSRTSASISRLVASCGISVCVTFGRSRTKAG